MSFEMIPIKNQSFDVGRVINFSKCNCEKCDFMNCPKKNYAVKMTKKVWKVADFWEEFNEEILEINKPKKWQYSFHDKYDLELNYKLLNEFIDMLFKFPKGTYWSPENKKWHTDDTDIEEQIYRTIALQKISRSGNIVNLGEISVRNASYSDFDLSATQEKLAIKISNALKELKELVFAYYQEQDKNWAIGWLSPEGRHYPCNYGEHFTLALNLGYDEVCLERNGWVHIMTDCLDEGYLYCRKLTAEQRNWLSLNGYKVEE